MAQRPRLESSGIAASEVGLIRSLISGVARRIGLQRQPELHYFAPGVNWSLDWDGTYITSEVERLFGIKARVVSQVGGLSGQIVHCASLWELAGCAGTRLGEHNKIVGTIFHGQKDAPQFREALEKVLTHQEEFARIHTASKIMEQRLLDWGIPFTMLARIPLGVDLERFRPIYSEEKTARRKELGIPEDAFCIGSLHKDGVGMAEGLEPKLIKGPDVFLKVVEMVNKAQAVFVLLSAPARGYVIRGLEQLRIPYRHIVLDDYLQIPTLFQALDVYLMTSREEGGPKGVLESMATGVPVVATRVGLVPEVITHGENGFVAESENVEALADGVLQLRDQPRLGKQFAQRGLQVIEDYAWPKIAGRYYHEIYEPILADLAQ
jgi:glycosyltransferase involved in cell wall biosynthesis